MITSEITFKMLNRFVLAYRPAHRPAHRRLTGRAKTNPNGSSGNTGSEAPDLSGKR